MAARVINKLIVHVSDSPDNRDIGLAEIEDWHRQRFEGVTVAGKKIHCGYHFIVRRSGTIEMGRPENAIGAHCKGFNKTSLGICWIGRSKMDKRQEDSLLNLLRVLLLKYALSPDDIYGHYELNPGKTCPNVNMDNLRLQLRQLLGIGRLT